MASRGWRYGYPNPVTQQLNVIGNTVERGMGNLGNVPLEVANLNFRRAQLADAITARKDDLELRKDQLDEMIRAHKTIEAFNQSQLAETKRSHQASESLANKQFAEQQATNQQVRQINAPAVSRAKGEMNRRDKDLTIEILSGGNPWRINHWLATGKREGDTDTMVDELAKAFGAEYKTEGKDSGYFVKKDGSRLKVGEFDDNPELGTAVVLGNTDVVRAAEDVKEQIEYERDNNVIAPGDEMLYQDQLQRVEDFLNSPEKQIMAMEQQIDKLSRFRGPGWEKGINRIQSKIDRLRGKEAKKGEQAFEMLKIRAKAVTEKDNRPKLQKEAQWMVAAAKADGIDVTPNEATQRLLNDRTLREALNAYAKDVAALPLALQGDPEAYAAEVQALKDKYQIEDRLKGSYAPGPPATTFDWKQYLNKPTQ